MLWCREIASDHGVKEKLVKDLINDKKWIFTTLHENNCCCLTKSVVDYAVSHGWGTSPEAQYPLGGVGDARSEGVGSEIASSTQLSYKAPKGKTTEVEAAGVAVETNRIKAEETRNAEDQRIYTEAQDATTKALSAVEEAHSVANAIDSSVIESPKQQGTLETPSGLEKDPPRWENLPEDPESEKKSIIDFHEALGKAGWQFSLRDIVRFHTSVRSEPLTILGGAPGSGKSSLARMYARYFGLGDETRFLSIDVQPSWHDRMDFLGFVKTQVDKPPVFVDAETGVAIFLRNAAKDQKGLWLACLEEINLARPEHYFADFLQRISLDDFEREKRPIKFYGLQGKEADKGSFTLVPSVRFVGTCNFDETTQNFSARFLDRCNYIELQPVPLQTMFFPRRGISSEIQFATPKWTWRPYLSASRTQMDTNKNAVIDLLDKLVPPVLKEKDSRGVLEKLGLIPSPRVVNGIIRYVEARLDIESALKQQQETAAGIETAKGNTADIPDLFSRAFDEAILQRLLPRLFFAQYEYPNLENEALRGKLSFILTNKSNTIKMDLCKKFLERFVQSSKEE